MRFGSSRGAGAPKNGSPYAPRVAVDLGSSRIRISLPDRRVLIDRPSSFPDEPEGEAAVSARALQRRRIDRNAWVDSLPEGWVCPIQHGMVTDAGACARLTSQTLREAAVKLPPGEVLLALPSTAGDRDRQRAVSAMRAAADCAVRTMEAPLAAAIGAGHTIDDPEPRLVMDIGAGLAEMAVIEEGRVVRKRSVAYRLEQPPGSPTPRLPSRTHTRVVEELQRLLDDLPSRSRTAVRLRGMLLTGGGALLPSLPGSLVLPLSLNVRIAPDPARATIRGLARVCLAPAPVREAVTSPAAASPALR